MALQLIEGFDHEVPYGNNILDWLYNKGWGYGGNFAGPYHYTATGRFGGLSWLQVGWNACYIWKVLPSPQNTMIVGVAFTTNPGDGPQANTGRVRFYNTIGGYCGGFFHDYGGSRKMKIVNSSDSVVATSSQVYSTNWNYAELKMTVNGASGSASLHMNGEEMIAPVTGNFGSSPIGMVYLWSGTSGGGGSGNQWDDMYVLDTTGSYNNDFLGDCRVETLFPSGAGSSTIWTPNSGANYAAVDEQAIDSDTTYVKSSVAGDKDMYVYDDVTEESVFGVQTCLTARKDSTNLRRVKSVARIGGVDYDSAAEHTLTTGYLVHTRLMDTDPAAAAWTAANLNAAEFGIKVST